MNLEELKGLKLNIEFDFNKPVHFSYKTMIYQHFQAEYLLSKFLTEHPAILSEDTRKDMESNSDFIYGYKIVSASYNALKGTGIENTHQYYSFYYHYCSFIKNQDKESVVAMGRVSKGLK